MTPSHEIISANLFKVTLFNISYYFSYDTLVAFQVKGQDMNVTDYYYSKTISKHLNTLVPKDKRINHVDFLIRLDKVYNEQFN